MVCLISGTPSGSATVTDEGKHMSSTTTPFAGTYAADPIHSSFGFAVRYQGVSLFRGTLNEVTATLADGRLEGAAKVESISIRTPDQFRAHVLSAEFFDAANHPEVTFSSSSLDLREDGTAEVDGELTIKGITRPVHAVGTWTEPAGDAFGGTRGHLKLEAVVDRTEFDMNWNLPLPSGGNALANEVTLTVELSLVAQQAA
jgi:polyisoprenoid-binding protein YceI